MKSKPFVPPKLPPVLDYSLLVKEIGEAHREIGKLSGLLERVPNPNLLTSPLLTKEAVVSSKIEGTQATLEEVLEYEAEEKTTEETEKQKDIREVINYRRAVQTGIDKLKERPIGENFIKDLHFVLMDSVRGANKDRGNFRRIQVWIGPLGTPMEEATYVPPPVNELPSLLSNWEEYVNLDKEKDPLVQIGVAHYQFEAIHPFMDGNGRVGRLLIPLFLYQKGILPYPLLYISGYFEKERKYYYDFLNGVSANGDWIRWLKFFLQALSLQALDTQNTILKMFNLYERLKNEVAGISTHAIKMLDVLFVAPLVSFPYIRERLEGVSTQTIYNLLKRFEAKGIVKEMSGRKRNKLYVFVELLAILK